MRKMLNTVPYFNIVAQTTENTVVTEYEPVKNRPDFYQSEAELEREFIRLLSEQGYTYLQIHNDKNLVANLFPASRRGRVRAEPERFSGVQLHFITNR